MVYKIITNLTGSRSLKPGVRRRRHTKAGGQTERLGRRPPVLDWCKSSRPRDKGRRKNMEKTKITIDVNQAEAIRTGVSCIWQHNY